MCIHIHIHIKVVPAPMKVQALPYKKKSFLDIVLSCVMSTNHTRFAYNGIKADYGSISETEGRSFV
jgi:hypothetical protein